MPALGGARLLDQAGIAVRRARVRVGAQLVIEGVERAGQLLVQKRLQRPERRASMLIDPEEPQTLVQIVILGHPSTPNPTARGRPRIGRNDRDSTPPQALEIGLEW